MQLPGSSSLRDRFENVPRERVQIYAQGASLTIYLMSHRPEQFTAYLKGLASSSGTARGRWRATFKKAFDDIDVLESDWKEWLLGLVPDPVNIGPSNGC